MDDDARHDDDSDDDLDDENEEIIRAKWVMDGASNLKQAASQLRLFADELESLESEGWELTGPVQDDYGFIRKPEAGALS
jgi:hypothetical protein